MKAFLDETFDTFNSNWKFHKPKIEDARLDFESGVEELLKVFGEQVARKPGSPQFNRAIFDALIYYHSQPSVRKSLRLKRSRVRKAYEQLFSNGSDFLKAVESDTAGAPNTAARLRIWGKAISRIVGEPIKAPTIPGAGKKQA